MMITGPTDTPYWDALFIFDILLPGDFPSSPPRIHYHSYSNERLNPNLYVDGKVILVALHYFACGLLRCVLYNEHVEAIEGESVGSHWPHIKPNIMQQ